MTEAQLSAAVAKWATEHGYMTTKLDAGRGWPDRLFVSPSGVVSFIEFKTPQKRTFKLSKLQSYTCSLLNANRANILATNDITQAINFLNALELEKV